MATPLLAPFGEGLVLEEPCSFQRDASLGGSRRGERRTASAELGLRLHDEAFRNVDVDLRPTPTGRAPRPPH